MGLKTSRWLFFRPKTTYRQAKYIIPKCQLMLSKVKDDCRDLPGPFAAKSSRFFKSRSSMELEAFTSIPMRRVALSARISISL